MIGTVRKNVVIINGGGGGSSSGLNSFNITFNNPVSSFSDSRLVGATLISLVSADFGVVNTGIDFNSGTGRITRNFFAGETVTITYTTAL